MNDRIGEKPPARSGGVQITKRRPGSVSSGSSDGGRACQVWSRCCSVAGSCSWHGWVSGSGTIRRPPRPGGSDPRSRPRGCKAIQELEHIGTEDTEVAIPALIVGLSDSDAEVRATAAMALVTVINGAVRTDSGGDDVRDAVTALLGSQKDPDAAVRSATAQALWMIVVTWQGPLGVIDLNTIDEALERFVADPDADVRHSAICGLGVIGTRISEEAPPGLLAALEDESPKNRITAAEYLARFPRKIIRMIPFLVKSMEGAQPPFRAAYAEILGQIRPPVFSADAIPGAGGGPSQS